MLTVSSYNLGNEMQTKMARKGEKYKQKWISDIQILIKKQKLRFDLKWREVQTKTNFGHTKWLPAKKFALRFDLKLRKVEEKKFGHPHVRPSCFEWYHFRLTVLYRKLVRHISLQYSRARDILYTTVSCFVFNFYRISTCCSPIGYTNTCTKYRKK